MFYFKSMQLYSRTNKVSANDIQMVMVKSVHVQAYEHISFKCLDMAWC